MDGRRNDLCPTENVHPKGEQSMSAVNCCEWIGESELCYSHLELCSNLRLVSPFRIIFASDTLRFAFAQHTVGRRKMIPRISRYKIIKAPQGKALAVLLLFYTGYIPNYFRLIRIVVFIFFLICSFRYVHKSIY